MPDIFTTLNAVRDNGIGFVFISLCGLLFFLLLRFYIRRIFGESMERLVDIGIIKDSIVDSKRTEVIHNQEILDAIKLIEARIIELEVKMETILDGVCCRPIISRLNNINNGIDMISRGKTIYMQGIKGNIVDIGNLLRPLSDIDYRMNVNLAMADTRHIHIMLTEFVEESRLSRNETKLLIDGLAKDISKVSSEISSLVQSLIIGLAGNKNN